tara:strand:- start:550 stop:738 length:189 start_codon:yes stop_codon:yes gene_type:complete
MGKLSDKYTKTQEVGRAKISANRRDIFEEELIKLRKRDYPIDETWVRQIAMDNTERRVRTDG